MDPLFLQDLKLNNYLFANLSTTGFSAYLIL